MLHEIEANGIQLKAKLRKNQLTMSRAAAACDENTCEWHMHAYVQTPPVSISRMDIFDGWNKMERPRGREGEASAEQTFQYVYESV